MSKLFIRLACLATLVCCSLQNSIGQKNTIKFTPLKSTFDKTNVGFERNLTNQYSIILDVQFWYISDKKHRRESTFDSRFPIIESNNGARFSLELRKYMTILKNRWSKINFYLGLGGFSGKHDISMIREADIITHDFGYIDIHELRGDIDLISSGAYLNPGVQFTLGKKLKVEFGVLAGKAWVNQKNDHLTLYSYEFYVLEEYRTKKNQAYSNKLSGWFFESMFNVGFSF